MNDTRMREIMEEMENTMKKVKVSDIIPLKEDKKGTTFTLEQFVVACDNASEKTEAPIEIKMFCGIIAHELVKIIDKNEETN